MESIITVQDVASADNPHQLGTTSSNVAIYAHVSIYEAPFLSKLVKCEGFLMTLEMYTVYSS